MELLKLGNAFQNVAYIVGHCAQQFGTRKGNMVTIDLPLAHKDIASMVGLTRETVSLEMKKMEQLGVIEYKRNNITIKNIDLFRQKTNTADNSDFT